MNHFPRISAHSSQEAVSYKALQPAELYQQIVSHDQDTYLLQVNCQVMKEAGINKGDKILVNRHQAVKNGSIVIVLLDGELLIRSLQLEHGRCRLVPACKHLSPIEIHEKDLMIWGVISHVIKCVP